MSSSRPSIPSPAPSARPSSPPRREPVMLELRSDTASGAARFTMFPGLNAPWSGEKVELGDSEASQAEIERGSAAESAPHEGAEVGCPKTRCGYYGPNGDTAFPLPDARSAAARLGCVAGRRQADIPVAGAPRSERGCRSASQAARLDLPRAGARGDASRTTWIVRHGLQAVVGDPMPDGLSSGDPTFPRVPRGEAPTHHNPRTDGRTDVAELQ